MHCSPVTTVLDLELKSVAILSKKKSSRGLVEQATRTLVHNNICRHFLYEMHGGDNLIPMGLELVKISV